MYTQKHTRRSREALCHTVQDGLREILVRARSEHDMTGAWQRQSTSKGAGAGGGEFDLN